jgi:flagellin-like hook-associated protein FlgL
MDNVNSIQGSFASTNLFQKSPTETILEAMKASREQDNPIRERTSHDQASTVYKQHVQDLTSQIRELNTEMSEVEVATEAVDSVESSLRRMKEITQEINKGVIDEDKRTDLTEEFQALAGGVDKLIDETAAGDKTLLDGGEEAMADLRAAKGMALLDDAAGNIERALQDTELAQENLSARHDRIKEYVESKAAALTKYEASEEKIASYDSATELAAQSKQWMQENAVTAYMTQVGVNPASAYFLLQ